MADINVAEVLEKLTVPEKAELLAGIDFWHTKAFPRLGIPSVRLSDGPNGVRGTRFFNGVKAACFPCGTSLGATFNTELLREAGVKMGEEAKAKGAHCILGPTINMQRSPLGGRGFESIGEDPFLAGLGAAAIVNGIQSTGIQATIKHFVCNDHEHKRNAVSAVITERALREIYCLPFQLAVRDSHPNSFMTGYNAVNGVYCSENTHLLQEILRGEWGWDGMVMSDWYGTYSTTDAAKVGLDLEMPGPPRFRGEALAFNAATDKIKSHVFDKRVEAVLNFVKRCAASGVKENAPEATADTPETAELLRRIGNEGLVLLKNDNDVLPLKKDKKTLIVGANAKVATYHGGGSASLAAYYAVTPFDGISSKLTTKPEYTVGQYAHKLLPLLQQHCKSLKGNPGLTMKVFKESEAVADRELLDEVEVEKLEMLLVDYKHPKITTAEWYASFQGSMVVEEDGEWEFSNIVAGTANLYVNDKLVIDNTTKQFPGDAFFGTATQEEKVQMTLKKGETYTIRLEFGSNATSKLVDAGNLPGGAVRLGGCRILDSKAEIARAVALAKEVDQVVISVGLNADWETEGHDRADMKMPPGNDELIEAVAKANPNTVVVMQSGTPVEMPWIKHVNGLVQAWYGGNETGNVIADILFGDVNPSGKLSLTFPIRVQDNPAFLNYRTEANRVLYGEDIYIGYRYYEFAQREVLFPFGHGLSYTTFAFADPKVEEKEGKLTASLTVTNTGKVAGKEVVQMYIEPKQKARVNRPIKEMKGFAKVDLQPGESKTVSVEVDTKYAGAFWDEDRDQWCVEAGEYDVILSNSSELKEGHAVRGSFLVQKTFWWSGL